MQADCFGTQHKGSTMELTRKKRGIWTYTIGAAGATAAACAACCISLPLLGPVLAWLSITGLGVVATGWYVAMAVVFAVGIAVFFFARQRRQLAQRNGTCGCSTSCKT
jgi:hypothetical protein